MNKWMNEWMNREVERIELVGGNIKAPPYFFFSMSPKQNIKCDSSETTEK